MKAYVLIKTHTGEILNVVHKLRQIEAVVDADLTFGPYDAVAIVETNDVGHLSRLLATDIQSIPGVVETLTCIAGETE